MKGRLPFTVVSCALLIAGCHNTQRSALAEMRPDVRLASETVGLDAIAKTLIDVFDSVDVVALGEAHGRRQDSDLRIALVRHPDFPKKVRTIIVEFANSRYQPILDRYIGGENVPLAQLQPVWQDTTQVGAWDSPLYAEFFAAVREVNFTLPEVQRLRVLAGDPAIDWTTIPDRHAYDRVMVRRDDHPAAIVRSQILAKGQKALLIYGSAHLYRNGGITKAVQATHPGKIFVVGVVGGNSPMYAEFDKALSSSKRPVLLSLRGTSFGNFSANDILGGELKAVKGLGRRAPGEALRRSLGVGTEDASKVLLQEVPPFQPNATLADVEDACVYFGRTIEVDVPAQPDPATHSAEYQAEIARRRRIIAGGRGGN
jgi:uncharacterized iron-regulated protein